MASKREEQFLEPDPVELPEGGINGDVEYLPNMEGHESPAVLDAWRTLEQAANEDPLLRRVLDSVHVLRRIGGVVQLAALREEVAPTIYRTVEFAWRWHDYNLKREREPQEQTEESEPAEVESG